MVKESIAVSFGYAPHFSSKEGIAMDTSDAIGALLQEMIVGSLQNVTSAFNNNSSVEFLGSTQASVAKLRHRSLAQEPNCSAVGDVLVVNVMVPKFVNKDIWKSAMEKTRDILEPAGVDVISYQLLGQNSKLHTESGCTQRIYHYLLPFAWLPNATELQDWWKSEELEITSHQHYGRKILAKPPSSLRLLKGALRSAECITIPAEEIRLDVNRTLRVASGRFGSLGARERRAWHNFADPSLRGDASPNNEPVWRVLDRARIVDFLEEESGGVVAVIEFRGDSFVKQQIRRVVGSAVAIAHGFLPNDYFELATADHTFIETPLAPSGRLYFAGARFHFEEMVSNGKPLFEKHKSRTIVELENQERTLSRVQRNMLQQRSFDSAMLEEAIWLRELQTEVCNRVLKRLSSAPKSDSITTIPANITNPCPDSHLPVVTELRRILTSGQWPETSTARSTVIRHDEQRDKHSYGSFTIVNPKVTKNWEFFPLGNERFQDLVHSVFELEMELAKGDVDRVTVDGLEPEVPTERSPSSHCAVNCNAQFTPHVDSGRGAGQSLSMIVGLGKYSGGELLVEGDEYDIQHKALEFDGWRLRHWTNPFAGERFSLVWFTPESNS
jgi:tRNA U38,U39,U40 pseudouridine synthase TruA